MKDETLESIGTVLTRTMPRDAVHFAVVQAVAATALKPGTSVWVTDRRTMMAAPCAPKERLGIVDPFLAVPLKGGQSFWIFLNPGSITSLKHFWTHPGLPELHPSGLHHKDAEDFLRECAERFGSTFEELLEEIRGGRVTVGMNQDFADDPEQLKKFWDSAEIILGETFDGGHRARAYFSCAC